MDYSALTALVTGASSGIGLEIARGLARRGIGRLILSARSQDALEALAGELQQAHGTACEVIVSDLAQPQAAETLKAETEARGLAVDVLVSNAGFGSHGAFVKLDPARERDMVQVNVAAVVALARLFLPGMVERGRGGILHVASTGAFQPVPYMATYGATKAFVLSFSEALWAEVQGTGVHVTCLCPGGTETGFGEAVGGKRGRYEKFPMSTAEEVAEGGLDAFEKNASYVVVGAANYAGALSARLAPRAVLAQLTAAIFRPDGEAAPPPAISPRVLAGLGGLAIVGGLLALRRR